MKKGKRYRRTYSRSCNCSTSSDHMKSRQELSGVKIGIGIKKTNRNVKVIWMTAYEMHKSEYAKVMLSC